MSNNFNESVSELKPDLSEARLRKRYRAETRFRIYGIAAILFASEFWLSFWEVLLQLVLVLLPKLK